MIKSIMLLLFSSTVLATEQSASSEQDVSVNQRSLPSTSINKTASGSVNFDIDSLKALGYGAEVADFFKQGSQYLPGQYEVTLIVNGSARYSSTVSFGKKGQLCVTPSLQKTLKLKSHKIDSGCVDFASLYPTTQVTPHPNAFAVDILVSESDFDPLLKGDELTYGGFALLNNYRIYAMEIKGWDTQHFYQGQFETGVNWNNWVLRNNSSISSGENSPNYQFNETTLMHSIAPWRAQLQLGQISSQGNLFGGTPLNGLQVYSDSALYNTNKLVVPVVGIAETASTVEVMQNGRLLYRTLVPAGPFELERINGVVSGLPLQVNVIQNDGRHQQFTVVTSNRVGDEVMSEPVYQFGLGQYRKRTRAEQIETPIIANIEASFSYQKTDYTGGILWSNRYQSIGTRLARQWEQQQSVAGSMGVQYSRNADKDGQQWNASLNTNIGIASLGLSSLYQTRSYPTLEETLQKEPHHIDDELETETSLLSWLNMQEAQMSNSISIGVGMADWGRIGYSLSLTNYYGEQSDSILHTLNYAKKIGNVSFNMSYQNGNDRDNRLFLNASIPLGPKSTFSAQFQQYQDDSTILNTYSSRPNNLWGYSMGVAHSAKQNRANGSFNATTAYSQLAASGSWDDDNNHSMMLSASGAVAYSNGLFATSPVALGDTFGLLSIPGQSGVQINTLGGGTTITNYFGTAAIPTLPINRKTTVQLDTKNLPLNVRLDTTSFDVAVARGTIISREVTATTMKQLLLGITLSDGTSAPYGSSVLDENDAFISIVMGNGNAMLTNEQIGQPIKLRLANQGECIVDYPVPEKFDSNMLYEEVDAICR